MSVAMKQANGAWVAGQGALLIGACVAAGVVASGAGDREPSGLGGCLLALAVGGALMAPSAGIGRVGPARSASPRWGSCCSAPPRRSSSPSRAC